MDGVNADPHAVLLPFPAHGHINPMMRLARKLVNSHGFFVTFVLTDFDRARLLQPHSPQIRLMSIPDGLDPSDTRTDFAKLCKSMENCMESSLTHLIHQINQTEYRKVTCLIADLGVLGWALGAAQHFHIPSAAFYPASIATYAMIYHIPTFLSSGILTSTGVSKENKSVEWLDCMPPLSPRHLPWLFGRTDHDNEFLFGYTVRILERVKNTNWIIFNSFYELEAPVINGSFPREASICPIGPLIPFQNLEGNSTSFWAEDVECLDWLDRQPAECVIYVSFGSVAVLNAAQLEELAVGLEATGRPFVWVVRPDLMDGTTAVFPMGFKERIKGHGYLVSWAPQLSVLSHPSIACFVTHCGWNSTLESISTGIPMICWPYFADQFLNSRFIVDVWKIGLALKKNKDGVIEAREIEETVERIVGKNEGAEMKKRVMELKKSAREAVGEGRSSSVNFNSFVKSMTTDT